VIFGCRIIKTKRCFFANRGSGWGRQRITTVDRELHSQRYRMWVLCICAVKYVVADMGAQPHCTTNSKDPDAEIRNAS
jgi:hypothetical protein